METRQVTEELLATVRNLPAERQEQLLKLARGWMRRKPSSNAVPSGQSAKSALVERDGLLFVSARLEGPLVDHREVRDEYLAKLIGPVE